MQHFTQMVLLGVLVMIAVAATVNISGCPSTSSVMPATSAAPEQSVLPATQDEEFTGSYAGEEKIDSNSYSVKCSVAFTDTVQQVYGVTEKTELNSVFPVDMASAGNRIQDIFGYGYISVPCGLLFTGAPWAFVQSRDSS